MGRGLAKLLAQKGANIVIVARNKQKLDEALRYISVSILHMSHLKLSNEIRSLPQRILKPSAFTRLAQMSRNLRRASE